MNLEQLNTLEILFNETGAKFGMLLISSEEIRSTEDDDHWCSLSTADEMQDIPFPILSAIVDAVRLANFTIGVRVTAYDSRPSIMFS